MKDRRRSSVRAQADRTSRVVFCGLSGSPSPTPPGLRGDPGGAATTRAAELEAAPAAGAPCTDITFTCRWKHPRSGGGEGEGPLPRIRLRVGVRPGVQWPGEKGAASPDNSCRLLLRPMVSSKSVRFAPSNVSSATSNQSVCMFTREVSEPDNLICVVPWNRRPGCCRRRRRHS